jgi:hypothetical protein
MQALHTWQPSAMHACPSFDVQELDDALRIGIPPGAITEVVGYFAAGLQSCCTMQLSTAAAASARDMSQLQGRHQATPELARTSISHWHTQQHMLMQPCKESLPSPCLLPLLLLLLTPAANSGWCCLSRLDPLALARASSATS